MEAKTKLGLRWRSLTSRTSCDYSVYLGTWYWEQSAVVFGRTRKGNRLSFFAIWSNSILSVLSELNRITCRKFECCKCVNCFNVPALWGHWVTIMCKCDTRIFSTWFDCIWTAQFFCIQNCFSQLGNCSVAKSWYVKPEDSTCREIRLTQKYSKWIARMRVSSSPWRNYNIDMVNFTISSTLML